MGKAKGGTIPVAGEGKRGESGHLGYLLRQASGVFRSRAGNALADLEVTAPQFAVLTMVGAYPGLSGADLARLTLLTPQTVNVIVANLKRSEALASTRHPVHGRILQLTLTPAGKSLLSRCKLRIDKLEAGLARGLSAADEKVIRRWLADVATERSRQ